jgi:membrane-associated phospholipid phosphatase
MILKRNERFITRDGMPYDIYGMPSGHAQEVFFSTIYNYLVLRDIKISIGFIIISFITIIQRVLYNHHTLLQVIIGSILGIIIGNIGYYFAKNNITGNLKEKPDDNNMIK